MQALQPKRTEHGGLYTWGLNKKNACGTEGKKTAATAKTKSKESEEIVPVCIYS
jgi:alpha-tubulin suppressor-like RCC1 family protein